MKQPLCGIMLLLSSILQAQVNFTEQEFDMVLAKAAAENKLVMVDAYTDWCGWCKVMDRETFSDSLVGAYVNPRFVSTKINMEEGFGVKLAMKYRISSYPTYLFFNPEGEMVGKSVGFMEPEPFIEELKQIQLPENRMIASTEPLNFDLNYPEFFVSTYKKGDEKKTPTLEEVETYLDQQEDLTTEVNWAIISRLIHRGKYEEKVVLLKEGLIAKYGEEEVNQKLAEFIFNDVKIAIKDSSQTAFESAMRKADSYLGERAGPYKDHYTAYYYQRTENWEALAAFGAELAKKSDFSEAASLNAIAWTIYENSGSMVALLKAIAWMKGVVGRHPEYAYMDTLAALYFKNGNKEQAQYWALKAIELGEENGEDVKATKDLLQQTKSM